VPGVEPLPLTDKPVEAPAPAGQDAAEPDTPNQDAANAATAARDKEAQQLARDKLHRRKRRVAFLAVLLVTIAVPAIVLVLLLG